MFAIVVYGFVGPTRPRPDPDTWWHLRTGRLILDTGALPSTDPFSWTASGRAWIPHEWLSQLNFAKVLETFGPVGLLLLASLMIGLALIVLSVTLRRLEVSPWAHAISLATAAYLSAGAWTVRPHFFSVFLMSLFLCLLVSHSRGGARKAVWWLVPLTLLWANLHGVFVAGLGLIWIFALSQLVTGVGRQLVIVASAASAVALLNPNGLGAFLYPLHIARVSDGVLEWTPPGIRDTYGVAIILLVIGVPSILAWVKLRPDPALFVSCLAFSVMGLAAVKNGWMTGLVLAPLLAQGLTKLKLPVSKAAEGTERLFLISAACLVVVSAFVFAAINLSGSDAELLSEDTFPVEAVDALNELPPGDVVNPYNWGGYLIWAAPRFPVSIDGRNDMYGLELLKEDEKVGLLRHGWDEFVNRPNVRYVLWNSDGALAQAMALLDGWELVYGDAKAVLYERSD